VSRNSSEQTRASPTHSAKQTPQKKEIEQSIFAEEEVKLPEKELSAEEEQEIDRELSNIASVKKEKKSRRRAAENEEEMIFSGPVSPEYSNIRKSDASGSRRSKRLQEIEPEQVVIRSNFTEEEIQKAYNELYDIVMPMVKLPKIKTEKLRKLILKNKLNVKKAVLTVKKNVGFYVR